jgi:hypothetical protein
MVGWVYAFVTPSMPGIVKFGATERDPTERLREANASTWSLPEYSVAAATKVDDPFAVERTIHTLLASRRVHPRREFFRTTADDARMLLALIAPDVSGELEVPVSESGGEPDGAESDESDEDTDWGDAARGEGDGRDADAQPDIPTAPSIGQTVILLGKMQESIGRLIDSPGGAWDTIESLGDIACALRTAASKHPAALAIAREMLDKLVAASTMGEQATELASCRFKHAVPALDPLATLSRFVETPEEKLRAWVEENYVRVPLRDKDSGTKLEALFGAYTASVPPVHAPLLGRNKFAAMLCGIRPDIGPYKGTSSNVRGLYLLR